MCWWTGTSLELNLRVLEETTKTFESFPLSLSLFFSGDQSAINELMQMRLRSGGTEGLLAEKLEVI